ncbi:carbohydrate ABC transporter permease [Ancrocorticia populi]|uniref:Carbohydrate ABC transporter permease n=1 Tax=Ancrocorticia populi TaxID=2175228 RepID=A0A2V1K8M9_9ACTO|nr:carbohydrate ABC transporter permease [Ancrocorticia populi]MDN6486501.1 carbohydrate ABC transporter permease [Ancrocorticia sp.]PWF26048.1 carbohydrate ABC transporter permease [Ancrocorticia populi]
MKPKLFARVIMYAVLVFLLILWMYPIVIAIVKSVQVGGWHNYSAVLNHDTFNYWSAIGNSFLMAGLSTMVIILISSLGGYAFSKMQFRGREVIYRALLACLAVPVAAVVTPLFFTVNTMGLRDTRVGVIIPMIAFNVMMMLLLMRNHFDSIPDDLLEAATLDGCGTFTIWRRVLMPLSGSALATVGVLSFVYCWNEFLLPNLLLTSPELFPVPKAISLLQFDRMSLEQISQLYAGLILMTIPSVIVYLFSQRYLQEGVAAGAVKN